MQPKTIAQTIVIAIFLLISLAVSVYSLFLLLHGPTNVSIMESSQTEFRSSSPSPAGLIPLGSAVLMMLGLKLRRLSIVWIGLFALAVFSGLFLFSIGGILVPVVLVLFLLLLALHLVKTF